MFITPQGQQLVPSPYLPCILQCFHCRQCRILHKITLNLSECLSPKAFQCLMISSQRRLTPKQTHPRSPRRCPPLRRPLELKPVSTCTVRDRAWYFSPWHYVKSCAIPSQFSGIISQLDQLILDYNHMSGRQDLGSVPSAHPSSVAFVAAPWVWALLAPQLSSCQFSTDQRAGGRNGICCHKWSQCLAKTCSIHTWGFILTYFKHGCRALGRKATGAARLHQRLPFLPPLFS